jgi:hypothetical protein
VGSANTCRGGYQSVKFWKVVNRVEMVLAVECWKLEAAGSRMAGLSG